MQNINTCLKLLSCNNYSTFEEIKSSFRKLVKTHHPDVGGDSKRFIDIQSSYDFILKHHRPQKLKIVHNIKDRYYRIVDLKSDVVKYPVSTLLKDTMLYFIMRPHTTEIRVHIDNDVMLPTNIKIFDRILRLEAE